MRAVVELFFIHGLCRKLEMSAIYGLCDGLLRTRRLAALDNAAGDRTFDATPPGEFQHRDYPPRIPTQQRRRSETLH